MVMFYIMVSAAMAVPTTFEATAYVRDCEGCSGYTAWKSLVADPWGPVKMMAIDPEVLDLGKCYRLRFEDGHESTYLAADTGGDIDGFRLDLLLKSEASARKFGRQQVTVVGEVACPVDVSKLPRAR